MRFSLKDLFWSVTLASLGMAALAILFRAVQMQSLGSGFAQLIPLLLITPGPLFGTAIGKLFHSATLGFWFGFLCHAITFASLTLLAR